jgi:sialic acid synthase SpsE
MSAPWLKDNRAFVIAEIGKNFIQTEDEKSYGEYLDNAKELIRLAKEAGADAVKFQTHHVEDEQANIEVTSPHFSSQDRYHWVLRNTNATPLSFWRSLKSYANEAGITFFSTPMSRGAAQILESLDVPFWKIGSGDILDFVLLDYIASTSKPVIISSGMSTVEEVDKVVGFLKRRNVEMAIMHCVSKYPCPPEQLNLQTINFFKERYDIPVGFSDHSLEIDSVLCAVALGAVIIEKHFSLSRDLWGPDHKASFTPDEFKEMVGEIRRMEAGISDKESILDKHKSFLGSPEKLLQDDETAFRPLFRKTLVALENIEQGDELTKEKIGALRPQAYLRGLPSEEYENILGKIALHNIRKWEPIRKDSAA